MKATKKVGYNEGLPPRTMETQSSPPPPGTLGVSAEYTSWSHSSHSGEQAGVSILQLPLLLAPQFPQAKCHMCLPCTDTTGAVTALTTHTQFRKQSSHHPRCLMSQGCSQPSHQMDIFIPKTLTGAKRHLRGGGGWVDNILVLAFAGYQLVSP
jgi:hypothetical protein